jgi:hypothetical protein
MACAGLDASTLASLVAQAKIVLRVEDDDATYATSALAIYHDESASATAATVAYSTATNTLTLTITDGANAGSYTYDTSGTANDTLTELVANINAEAVGFVATLVGEASADAALLVRLEATSCFGQSNEQVLDMENEELLETLITNIFAAIETGLRRCIMSSTYSEVYERPRNGTLVLAQPTLTQVTMVGDTHQDGLKVQYTGADTHARVEVTDTAVITSSRAGATTTSTTTLFTDQVTTTLMASTINALAGWTASVVTDAPSAFLVRGGVQDVKSREVVLETWDDTTADYVVYYDEGIIEFQSCGAWPVERFLRIDYTAGYATLPDDVFNAVLGSIKIAWDVGARSTGTKSEKLGDYAYTLFDTFSGSSETVQMAASSAVNTLFTKYARVLP